ncbi:hypothetical protein [Prevotella amnii]|uniref:hypothetical protein n=1 Tax=Prevotella amnii TaxID=419005 RepID=UPI0012FDABA5|nr:hypothetical protein [Prevotella amnii]
MKTTVSCSTKHFDRDFQGTSGERYGRDLTGTADCSIWIYFPFPILLYILILLLTYSNIVV